MKKKTNENGTYIPKKKRIIRKMVILGVSPQGKFYTSLIKQTVLLSEEIYKILKIKKIK